MAVLRIAGLQPIKYRQRDALIAHIADLRLADLLSLADVREQVIDNLEGNTQVFSIHARGQNLLVGPAAKNRPALSRCSEQAAGFVTHNFDIILPLGSAIPGNLCFQRLAETEVDTRL